MKDLKRFFFYLYSLECDYLSHCVIHGHVLKQEASSSPPSSLDAMKLFKILNETGNVAFQTLTANTITDLIATNRSNNSIMMVIV